MKKLFFLIFFLPTFLFAQKEQLPDTLIWGARRYTVVVPRDVPSVLQTYFLRTYTSSPFQSWSSENHRGHFACFQVVNNQLCLSSIKAIRYKIPSSNLWAASGIDTVVGPDFFSIHSLNPDLENVADWFSGILRIELIPNDKTEAKSDEARGFRLLHIVDGAIVDNLFFEKEPKKGYTPQQTALLEMYGRFVNFYTRCAADREEVSFNGHAGLFEHALNHPTLLMPLFSNNPLLWPYNWQGASPSAGAPFGTWLLRSDSLFLVSAASHSGSDPYIPVVNALPLNDILASANTLGSISLNADGRCLASWLSGDFVVHYGSWQVDAFGIHNYVVSKTQKLRLKNGVVLSSSFSPSSFDDDSLALSSSAFHSCNPDAVFSIDDKQLASAVGSFPKPKVAPTFEGGVKALRNWFLNNGLTDQRARQRLFRVRIAFQVNCEGKAFNFKVVNNPKGELFEFSNMVLDIVKNMPQLWHPATDRRGKPVDCWQILEFTVSNGILTNANYK